MTVRKVWVGSVGPYLYDDTDLINDSDGDIAGMSFAALSTTGQLHVEEPPTESDNVLRQMDVGSAAFQTYTEGTFVLTAVGYTTTVTVTARYAKIGKLVTLTFPTITGTSNSTNFSATGMPASLFPIISPIMPVNGFDNAVLGVKTMLVTVTGTLLFQNVLGSNASWTASGTKGIYANTVSYITV
jgi:hypothetical protein